MRVSTESYEFDTRGDFDVVDLTGWAGEAVRRSGIEEGIALVYAGHSTGVIVLNEYDSALIEDLRGFLRRLVLSGFEPSPRAGFASVAGHIGFPGGHDDFRLNVVALFRELCFVCVLAFRLFGGSSVYRHGLPFYLL